MRIKMNMKIDTKMNILIRLVMAFILNIAFTGILAMFGIPLGFVGSVCTFGLMFALTYLIKMFLDAKELTKEEENNK